MLREEIMEEIMGSLKKMKGGKAAGIDGIVEILKSEGISIIYYFLRIFNRCVEFGAVERIGRQRV